MSENNREKYFFRASAADFKIISGSPIAYWVSEKFLDCFTNNIAAGDLIALKAGMSTGDNTIFQRTWHEVAICNIGFGLSDMSTYCQLRGVSAVQ